MRIMRFMCAAALAAVCAIGPASADQLKPADYIATPPTDQVLNLAAIPAPDIAPNIAFPAQPLDEGGGKGSIAMMKNLGISDTSLGLASAPPEVGGQATTSVAVGASSDNYIGINGLVVGPATQHYVT